MITLEAYRAELKKQFPGCVQETGGSLNGEVASVTLWEFHIHGSLTTRKVSLADTVGEITLCFWQKQEGRQRRPLKRRSLTTKDAGEMVDFIKWCAAWVMGVLHALETAFESPPSTAIGEGLLGLLDRT